MSRQNARFRDTAVVSSWLHLGTSLCVRVRNVLVVCLYVFKKENRKLMLFLERLLLVPCVCLLSFLERFVVCVSVRCVCASLWQDVNCIWLTGSGLRGTHHRFSLFTPSMHCTSQHHSSQTSFEVPACCVPLCISSCSPTLWSRRYKHE